MKISLIHTPILAIVLALTGCGTDSGTETPPATPDQPKDDMTNIVDIRHPRIVPYTPQPDARYRLDLVVVHQGAPQSLRAVFKDDQGRVLSATTFQRVSDGETVTFSRQLWASLTLPEDSRPNGPWYDDVVIRWELLGESGLAQGGAATVRHEVRAWARSPIPPIGRG